MNIRTVLSLLALTSVAFTFTPPGLFRNIPPGPDHYRELYRQRNAPPPPVPPPSSFHPNQAPIMSKEEHSSSTVNTITISDILPRFRRNNIFASLTRDISSVSSRLESTQPSQNTTLLAPLNSAMERLPRKPWEDREDDPSGVSAARNEDKAAANLQKFVEHHCVPTSPWQAGEKVESLGGQKVWWETKSDGKTKVVMPGEIEVEEITGTANGEVWSLKGVLNYQ